ncbi:MAG: hypothetical protein K5756_04590 [Clostridiales bacterium]|nr:hypothetical protein [Clostridiales bacterium]
MIDIVCVDGEIKTVYTEIKQFLDHMISNIVLYNQSLKLVQMNDIKDEKIRAKLENLSVLLKEYKKKMELISEKVEKDKTSFLKDFEKNDVFKFPMDSMGDIDILMSMFK